MTIFRVVSDLLSVVFNMSARNSIINHFFATKSFYPRQKGRKRRYYEQECIQDSFLHSEGSSKQRRQVGNHDPFDCQWRNRTIQLQLGCSAGVVGCQYVKNGGQFLESMLTQFPVGRCAGDISGLSNVMLKFGRISWKAWGFLLKCPIWKMVGRKSMIQSFVGYSEYIQVWG